MSFFASLGLGLTQYNIFFSRRPKITHICGTRETGTIARLPVVPASRREMCTVPRVTGNKGPQNTAARRNYQQNIADVTEKNAVTSVIRWLNKSLLN